MHSVRSLAFVTWLLGSSVAPAAIVINCVGDSITAGAGLQTYQTYPVKLQQLLGSGYSVNNFGVSGTTLLKNGDFPYWNTTQFTTSHNRPTPAIVLIMLGTNDSKPQNWAYGTNFVSDYTDFIASYTNISPAPRIIICTPPPVFSNGNFNINPGIVATNISPLIRQFGTNSGIQVIDFQTLLAGHGEWFQDTVHPNTQGTSVMAAIFYTALQGDTMNGVVPSLALSPLASTNVVLTWPSAAAGWVLQTGTGIGDTNTWVIDGAPAVTDGTFLHTTNAMAGTSSMFRLWWPSN